MKKPQWQKVFAVLLCWIASYSVVIPLTMIVAYFFPREMFSVSGSLNDFMASVPLAVSVFISCVMPAVCEEAVHRGFILKSFQSRIQGKWILVMLMGLLFGLFHGNLWRFLPTALLGAALTYLMVETENMIYPALFHFINNFFPTLLSGITGLAGGGADTQAVTQSLAENGSSQIGPFLMEGKKMRIRIPAEYRPGPGEEPSGILRPQISGRQLSSVEIYRRRYRDEISLYYN